MLCLFQCQSDSALTRTYWSSRGTAGRNSRFKLFLLLILGAFSFVLSAILNSQASYRCTLVPRLPFPVPRSPFPVPRSPFPVPPSPFLVLVTSPHKQRFGFCDSTLFPYATMTFTTTLLRNLARAPSGDKQTCGHDLIREKSK